MEGSFDQNNTDINLQPYLILEPEVEIVLLSLECGDLLVGGASSGQLLHLLLEGRDLLILVLQVELHGLKAKSIVTSFFLQDSKISFPLFLLCNFPEQQKFQSGRVRVFGVSLSVAVTNKPKLSFNAWVETQDRIGRSKRRLSGREEEGKKSRF